MPSIPEQVLRFSNLFGKGVSSIKKGGGRSYCSADSGFSERTCFLIAVYSFRRLFSRSSASANCSSVSAGNPHFTVWVGFATFVSSFKFSFAAARWCRVHTRRMGEGGAGNAPPKCSDGCELASGLDLPHCIAQEVAQVCKTTSSAIHPVLPRVVRAPAERVQGLHDRSEKFL